MSRRGRSRSRKRTVNADADYVPENPQELIKPSKRLTRSLPTKLNTVVRLLIALKTHFLLFFSFFSFLGALQGSGSDGADHLCCVVSGRSGHRHRFFSFG